MSKDDREQHEQTDHYRKEREVQGDPKTDRPKNLPEYYTPVVPIEPPDQPPKKDK
jgi:hypothetical protein